jgi:GDP-L-fucose synthase
MDTNYLYNVGTSEDLTIKHLAETIQKIVGQGEKLFGMTLNPMELPEE